VVRLRVGFANLPSKFRLFRFRLPYSSFSLWVVC
jgi:hypothetical protein